MVRRFCVVGVGGVMSPSPVGREILLISLLPSFAKVLRNKLQPLLVSDSRYSCTESSVNADVHISETNQRRYKLLFT